jgi:hypothetical protein
MKSTPNTKKGKRLYEMGAIDATSIVNYPTSSITMLDGFLGKNSKLNKMPSKNKK